MKKPPEEVVFSDWWLVYSTIHRSPLKNFIISY